MEQHNSRTRENVAPQIEADPTESDQGLTDILPQQQGSLPDGGDFSSSAPVGASKPDPNSSGPTVHDTIAGRN